MENLNKKGETLKKIFVFLGYSGSGKSTLEEYISENMDIPRLISHTSRPPRDVEEVRTQAYHFVSDTFFKENEDEFIEHREYQVATGDIWNYGIHESELDRKTCAAVVVDPYGYSALVGYFKDTLVEIVPIFVQVDKDILETRLIARGDDKEEIDRRLADDKERFTPFLEKENYYTVCNNESPDVMIYEAQKIINNEIKEVFYCKNC